MRYFKVENVFGATVYKKDITGKIYRWDKNKWSLLKLNEGRRLSTFLKPISEQEAFIELL